MKMERLQINHLWDRHVFNFMWRVWRERGGLTPHNNVMNMKMPVPCQTRRKWWVVAIRSNQANLRIAWKFFVSFFKTSVKLSRIEWLWPLVSSLAQCYTVYSSAFDWLDWNFKQLHMCQLEMRHFKTFFDLQKKKKRMRRRVRRRRRRGRRRRKRT